MGTSTIDGGCEADLPEAWYWVDSVSMTGVVLRCAFVFAGTGQVYGNGEETRTIRDKKF